ncbi:DNA repair protein rad13 [Escovopsis weberi]|uniref:DNA repair protein rad13 n=1 Tax=Escovopsis weberi TaxID=150374 RepID=A0A0M8N2G2_ESCWE|nr:DNA repair protein rad13 [Escovopsis weberi]
MGVNGLWTVVQPCARPTNLATLNRKRLAVDASIWIYQFLKAVRDKEGNALRNSHVVGFFRRICKLLWFGIQPVFVFDGGAPALKRATIQQRKRRREGRREDAVRTAGKLLAVQMQRLAEEEEERRKRDARQGRAPRAPAQDQEEEEELPDLSTLVYVDEIGLSQQERLQKRKFHKKDAYHLPELEGGIGALGNPDDPRIMSAEELDEYARQFNNGEDVNLYDFSKIDFNGDFFKSLPAPDRYNILNAARLRSRLRMGFSKDQLDDMFPDRMAFSRFQIERVRERNNLTQRLMLEVGMGGTDLTLGVNARIAGEKDREYILVKNEGVEGGWALGVVSKEKDAGEAHKPIDVDALQFPYQVKEESDEDDEEFEDVPIEGVNRLPRPRNRDIRGAADDLALRRRHHHAENGETQGHDYYHNAEESLFVGGNDESTQELFGEQSAEQIHDEEDDDLNLAIALSLQNQHGIGRGSEAPDDDDVDSRRKQPEWTQTAAESQRPIKGHGSMISHIVNNRANAAVASRQASKPAATSDNGEDEDEDEDDMQTVLARSRQAKKSKPEPLHENKKNPFDGPLPFPKLDWRSSLFAHKKKSNQGGTAEGSRVDGMNIQEDESEAGGGFLTRPARDEDEPIPLPPWMTDETDIREALKQQNEVEKEINAEDRADAEEEEKRRRRELQNDTIHIDSSSNDESDIQIIEIPPSPDKVEVLDTIEAGSPQADDKEREEEKEVEEQTNPLDDAGGEADEEEESESMPEFEEVPGPTSRNEPAPPAHPQSDGESSEPELEDVPPAESTHAPEADQANASSLPTDAPLTGLDTAPHGQPAAVEDDEFDELDYEDDFSDPGDEELLAQLAEEAEGHAQFASELNKKSAEQNKAEYEKELRALRTQQKKDRRDADEVTQIMIEECQALLRLFGIPYITAPMEAEAQCAELVRLSMVDGIVTDDSDTFLFGGTRVYKNVFNGNKFVECYLGSDLEKEMSLSRDQLISLAQLLGSDYTEGLPGIGPVTAVEILSEFPGKDGLHRFREWWTEVQAQTRPKEADASSAFRRKFRRSQATKLFLPPGFPSPAVYDAYLMPEVDSSTEPFQWGVPDVEGLRRFLMATIGWSRERTDEVLVPVIRDMNKRDAEGTQSNITKFFRGAVGVGAAPTGEAFAPRQRTQGSKRMLAAVDRLRRHVGDEGLPDETPAEKPEKRRKKR